MLFCPTCANLLVVSSETGYNKWACNSCPYEFPITKQVRRASLPSSHERSSRTIDDLAHEARAQSRRRRPRRRGDVETRRLDAGCVPSPRLFSHAHIDIALVASCDKCNNDKAYFYQLQIRSADEPMTTCACPFSLCSPQTNKLTRPSSLPVRPFFLSFFFCGSFADAVSCRCTSCAHQWREN